MRTEVNETSTAVGQAGTEQKHRAVARRGRHRYRGPQSIAYRRIIRLALPMVLSTVAVVAGQVVVLALIGHMNESALYVRSVYTPVFYVFLAVTTGLSVTVQVAAARDCGRGERQAVAEHLGSVARAAAVLFVMIGGVLLVVAGPLSDAVGVSESSRGTFHAFLVAMTAATVISTFGELCSGALRGAGRTGVAAAVTALYLLLNIGIVAGAVSLGGGLMIVPVAAGVAGTAELLLGLGALIGLGLVRPRRLAGWRPETWRMLLHIGLPVGISSVVLAVVNLLLLRIVAPAGEQAVAGFNVGYTLQSAVIVPAVGLGSAISVLMNQTLPDDGLPACRTVFRRGMLLATAGYAAVTVAIIAGGGALAGVMAGDPTVAEQAAQFVLIVGPTFGCTGLSLVVLTILEQVGHGLIAVLMNTGYFLVVLGVGWLMVNAHDELSGLYWTMATAAVVGLAAGLPITIRAALNPRIAER